MTALPETPFVELHRLKDGRAEVYATEGDVRRLGEGGRLGERLHAGDEVETGHTIMLGPGATARIGERLYRGGRHGLAHAFVELSAFRGSPSRADVPRLIHQLREIELQLGARMGLDPLASEDGPSTPHERAASAEFARANLVLDEARALSATVAQAAGAVTLFFCDEAAFVAVEEVSLAKLRLLMEALGRPVNPHLVEGAVLAELHQRVYGEAPFGAPS